MTDWVYLTAYHEDRSMRLDSDTTFTLLIEDTKTGSAIGSIKIDPSQIANLILGHRIIGRFNRFDKHDPPRPA